MFTGARRPRLRTRTRTGRSTVIREAASRTAQLPLLRPASSTARTWHSHNAAASKRCTVTRSSYGRRLSRRRPSRLLPRQFDGEFAVGDALRQAGRVARGGVLAVGRDQLTEG